VASVARAAAAPVERVARVVGPVTAPVVGPLRPVLEPVGGALAPVGSALAPVGSALAPITGPVGGLTGPVVPDGLLPLPGLVGSGRGSRAGPGAGVPAVPFTGFEGTGSAAGVASASPTYPVRLAADGASSPATRSIRSWPALTGAVSLPGFPASAELPAGGPDPLSASSGAAFALAALAAVLLLLGPLGRGRARPDRSRLISRSYLPLVSPA
jgi:DNA polymerase-3 subunit gamma/tau